MTRPNLRTARAGDHSECFEANPGLGSQAAWVDDVRRCHHGIVQVCYQPEGGMRGPGTLRWKDLSTGWWDRHQYRQAVALLEGVPNDPPYQPPPLRASTKRPKPPKR